MNSGTGTGVVRYNQTGDDNYNAAPEVTASVDAVKADQSITVVTPSPATAAYNTSFTVAATATSGLPVAYTSTAPLGNVGALYTMNSGIGTGVVKYNQAGDDNYNAAPEVTANVDAVKADQSITVVTPSPATAAYNTSFTVAATATSGLPVTYTSTAPLSNVNGLYTMNSGIGTGVVKYNQAGDNNYNAAPEVTANVDAGKANQTIIWANPSDIVYGTALSATQLNASVSVPGLELHGDITYNPVTGTVLNAGANQDLTVNVAGTTNYNPATKTVKINVNKLNATVLVASYNGVYDGSPDGATGTATGVGGVDLSAGLNLGAQFINVPGGTAHWTFSGGANYNDQSGDILITITKRPVTVTADAKTKEFGTDDPLLTHQTTSGNLITGDAFSGALTRVSGENIGTYPINQGTLALTGNYALTFVGADFTITAKTSMPSVTVSPTSVQYSDMVTFTAKISVGAMLISGRSHPEASVTFKVGNQEMGTVPLKVKGLDLEGKLTTAMVEKIKGQMAPGNKTVYAVFNFPNSKIKVTPNPATTNLTITREDVRVNYTGSYLETGSGSGSKSSDDHSNVFLRATVQDITAVRGDHDWDPFAGDIRNAKVRFLKGSVPITNWLTPDLVNGRDSKTGVVSAKWGDFGLSADIPGDINIEVGGNGYYVRNNPADLSVVTLYAPNGDYVAGGGYLVNPYHSDGTYAGDPGLKTNFGFVVKYKNKGTNLQGNMDIIFRREVDGVIHTYQVNSTSITSLGVNVASHHALRALIAAKANLNDITDPGLPVLLGSLLKLQVSLTDNGESGVSDMIGISLWDGSTLLFSSNWTGSNTSEKQIGDGNLIVHSGSSFGDINNPPDDHHNEHMLSAELGVKAYPNPFTDHVYFDLMLQTESKVRLEIYDVTGTRIATLFNDVVLAYNRYQLEYTPENFSSGVLLYRLIIDDQIAFTGKLIHK